MSEHTLRVFIGFYILIIQLALIAQATYHFYSGGFIFNQFTTVLGLVVPLFAGYVSIIVKYFISTKFNAKRQKYDETISAPFVVLSFVFPTILAFALMFCIYSAALSIVFRNFEDVKITIGLVQAAFGVYTGQFVYSLFSETFKSGSRG